MAKYLSLLMSFLIITSSSQNIFAVAREFKISKPAPGVMIIHDENGNWGGNTMGLTHQVSPEEEIKKIIDLSELPDDVLKNAKQARVRIYFGLVDWSHNTGPKIENGLDEEFEIVVNGHSHVYKTNEGFPTRESKQSPIPFDWTDFIIPVSELIKGRNKIIVRKTKSEKFDDYIYVGIDNTVEYGHSACKLPGGYWQRKELNNVKAQGEYMIRLVLLEKELRRSAEWEKGKIASDPEKLIGFVEEKPSELIFQIDPERIDKNSRITTKVKVADPDNVILKWFDANNNEISGLEKEVKKDLIISSLERLIRLPNELVIFTKGKVEDITSVTIDYSIPYIQKPWINMCPRISEAKGSLKEKRPYCNVGKEIIELGNAYYSVRFSIKPKLRMESFFVNYLSKNILQSPETRIFLLETEGKGLGADDFIVREVKKESSSKVELVLISDEKLEAKLILSVDEGPEFRMGLTITNRADSEKEFKIAFPHLAGICLSDNLDNDYYLFPYKGGVISPLYSEFRTAYGENTCWWQMIDIFSPTGGAGVYLRSDDTTGLYKVPVLLKSKPGKLLTPGETSIGRYMDPDMLWEKSLKSGDGIAMAFEFLKRKRAPNQSFSPPDAVIGVHEGDWHEAMKHYSKWAHKVWRWRPYPSVLTDCWFIKAVGIGHLPLFRNNKYRTEELDSEAGAVETGAWWEWSSIGPWGVKLDDNVFGKKLGSVPSWTFEKDPVTGERKYCMNRGDLPTTYNKAWGGLPAFREYIQQLKVHDKLTTLYYDGFLACDTTQVGQKYGKKYGVMNPYWTNNSITPSRARGYVDLYGSWNMCIDTKFWQYYVAKGLKQVMMDTGVDGIRLDEIGHQGYTCFNPNHKHIFAEPGHNAWLQAASLLCKKVHQAMDEVNPASILMTEFPGTDFMASNLEGCISYETQNNKIQARPVLVDLFNFYFKECKIYDLNGNAHISPKYSKWNIFNGKAFFYAGYYEYDMFYIRILKENGDVFSSTQREALIPTMIEGIYANRWIGKDKTIITFINAKPYTIEGSVIEVPKKGDYHYFDFLSGKEVKSDGKTISLKLPKGEVACVACLPDILDVQAKGNVLRIKLKLKDPSGYRVVVSDEKAKRLVEKEAASSLQFDLSEIEGDPMCVKLFKGKYLEDARAIPIKIAQRIKKEKMANQIANRKARYLSKAVRNNKNGHLYLRVDKEIDWNAAMKECKGIGGYLVTITSADEQDWVFNNLGRELLAEHWMGGTDSEREGDWRWVTNELFSYTNWAQNEPNNVQNEDYMSFHWTSDGKWNDSQGEAKKKGYICEWESKK